MRIRDLNKNVRKLSRYKDIARILLKNGFHLLLEKLDLAGFAGLNWRLPGPEGDSAALAVVGNESLEVRLRRVFEELGPGFVKLGQILSVRPDLIPPGYVSEFKKLQSHARPLPYEEMLPVIREEIPRFEERFQSIDRVPLGSGSIAQVFPALLKDGTPVVIKVQRPTAAASFQVDIDILFDFASLLQERLPELREFNLPDLVAEFQQQVLNELNFRVEAFNQEKLRRLLSGCESVRVPTVFSEFTSERILVSERVEAIGLEEYLKNPGAHDLPIEEVVGMAVDTFFQQVLVHGFFHADPHPGNIKIDPISKKIIFLDFGFMGRLNYGLKLRLVDLFSAFAGNDPAAMTRILVDFSTRAPEDLNIARLEEEVEFFIDFYRDKKIEEIHLGRLFMEVIEITRKYALPPPAAYIVLAKSLVTVESFARDLVPRFNLVETAAPYLEKAVREVYHPANLVAHYRRDVLAFGKTLIGLPRHVSRLLSLLNRGKLHAEFGLTNLSDLTTALDRTSHRIALALIISSLILASSVLLSNSDKGLLLHGVSIHAILGFFGYLLALFFGFWLVLFVFRSGKI